MKADPQRKAEGEDDPELTYAASGFVMGDALSGSLAREPGEAPGTYAITQGTLTAGDNYVLTFEGAALTIEAKPRPVLADYTMFAKLAVSGKTALKLTWTKVEGAKGYDIFFAKCGNKLKHKTTVSASDAREYKFKGLKKRTVYKAYVRAWTKEGGAKAYIGAASPAVHAITGGYDSKRCNAKSIKLNKKSLALEVGKTKKLKATVKAVKSGRELIQHASKVRYYTSDVNVATVNGKGVVKAVGPGGCTVWAITNNGLRASVKINVK